MLSGAGGTRGRGAVEAGLGVRRPGRVSGPW